MKKFVIVIIGFLLSTSFSFAQKEIKQVKSYLKSGSNLNQAEKIINDFINKPENKTNTKYYQIASEVQKRINDVENEKLYLKQKYDTVQFFNSIRNMFLICERCDSLERDSLLNPKHKFKYRKVNNERLKPYRENLANGGKFFFAKKKYAEAFDFFDTYISTAYSDLFKSENYLIRDKKIPRIAYYATFSGDQLKNPKAALKYSELAILDTINRPLVMQYKADAYKELHDTLSWVKTLKEGIFSYPKHSYFFVNLMDYFNDRSKYEEGLMYANGMLERDSMNTLYLYAKVLALQNMHKYVDAIKVSNKILDIDSTYVEAYYNIAIAYCNQALNLEANACVNVKLPQFKIDHDRIQQCYRKARPYMEKVKKLLPNDKLRWGPSLYRIYLNLNLGKEFDEIDKILNSSPTK
jgi:tetratricopeptide (TPR) repeat protein